VPIAHAIPRGIAQPAGYAVLRRSARTQFRSGGEIGAARKSRPFTHVRQSSSMSLSGCMSGILIIA
jgi:hypothetical protein